MKMSHALVITLVSSHLTFAQTPTAVGNIAATPTELGLRRPAEAGPNNPWTQWAVAGEASIKSLAGDGKFSEGWLLSSAKLTYEIPMDGQTFFGAHLPVMANLAALTSALGDGTKKDSVDAAIKSLTSSTDGLNIGVYPYWPLKSSRTSINSTLFLLASAKVNSFKDTLAKDDRTLLTGRFGAGIEFQIGDVSGDHKPLTISLTAIHSRFGADAYEAVFKERRSHLNSAEMTAILPLSTSAGALFEVVGIDQAKPAFRLGIMVAAGKSAAAKATQTGAACGTDGCGVQVKTDLTESVSVSEKNNAGKAKDQTNQCAVTVNKTCTFTVVKDKPATFEVPDGYVISADACKDKNTKTCSLAANAEATLTVTKAPK